MKFATNPILTGFNPDPSIIRVGDDYFIATSTFEWFPGVQIHHSKDLIHWELIGHALTKTSQLDMRGNPDSCGVWAPCLSYSKGIFYLVYSNVRSFDGAWKDTPNYLVTTDNIFGEWSDPIYLNSSGFDASLFHDKNGKKWLTNMIVDHRKNRLFGGIILQEYDERAQKLVGSIHYIFSGTELGATEAPHIYKKNGYYYLITAEGGTEYNHAVTMARSKKITGAYEVHPENPIITSRHDASLPLQKAGHADIVETPSGDWYAVFLVGRPLSERGRCTLGRETAIKKMEWRSDDWLWAVGDQSPSLEVEVPDLPTFRIKAKPIRNDFNHSKLDVNYASLRIPVTEDWASLNARKGYLRLYGQESLSSFHYQSLIARRVDGFNIEAITVIEFEPINFQQMAGLVTYYNSYHYHYLHIAGDDNGRKLLQIITCDKHEYSEALEKPIDVTGIKRLYLKLHFNGAEIQFYYSQNEDDWQPVGGILDGSILSDDYVQFTGKRYRPAFTGAFVGVCCQDLSGQGLHADFDYFEYQNLE